MTWYLCVSSIRIYRVCTVLSITNENLVIFPFEPIMSIDTAPVPVVVLNGTAPSHECCVLSQTLNFGLASAPLTICTMTWLYLYSFPSCLISFVDLDSEFQRACLISKQYAPLSKRNGKRASPSGCATVSPSALNSSGLEYSSSFHPGHEQCVWAV